MEKMLEKLHPLPEESSIFQVSKQQREMNTKAYLPQIFSIGPFHSNTQKDLIANEQYKLQAFVNFLYHMINGNDHNIVSLKDILKAGTLKFVVQKSHSWMEQVRDSYASSINMKEEEFFIMMLVDIACFIIQFFRHPSLTGPFFLLQRLLNFLPTADPVYLLMCEQDIANYSTIFYGYTFSSMDGSRHIEPKHLVDYLNYYFPSPCYDMTYNKQ
uniref:Uncharacterized protein n=1 Tax=Cucumis sativus TaxID=3659 RepID=A0A0A0LKU4_CUCSA